MKQTNRTLTLKTEEPGDESHEIIRFNTTRLAIRPPQGGVMLLIEIGPFCACRRSEFASPATWVVTRRGHAGINSYGHIFSYHRSVSIDPI